MGKNLILQLYSNIEQTISEEINAKSLAMSLCVIESVIN